MQRKYRKKAICLAAGLLLCISLACNLPTLSTPPSSTPEVQIIVVTATEPGPSEDLQEEAVNPTATSASSGVVPTLPIESDIFASVSIVDGNASFTGKISFPGADSSDEIYIKPAGFDSTATSGSLVFRLTCSGEGNAKVNYKGGAIESGSPGCGETWAVGVVTGSADSHITVRLDDRGEVDWTLSVTGGG